jgi:hypothetical protein
MRTKRLAFRKGSRVVPGNRRSIGPGSLLLIERGEKHGDPLPRGRR